MVCVLSLITFGNIAGKNHVPRIGSADAYMQQPKTVQWTLTHSETMLLTRLRDAAIGQPVREPLRPALQRCQFGPVSHIEAVAAAGEDVSFHGNFGFAVCLEKFYDRLGAASIVIRRQ